ncbi:alpha/beta fold hydrolase [Leisingera sp. ANG-Vp]|uniref:alpha/beta fold hydrolase n=1 Tax=Leisingera sp. ANG-Vp TaxID=1577896 RepID=UPI00057FA26A|nr:alpha/beta hydrolase [Leisingera sp. ANG-Vp]KIC18846.1 alpha/beta hydrolase [Leisingera sp. ANG-Vp]
MKDLPAGVFSRSFGNGPRQVLAVHCSLAHSGAWRGLAAELAEEATLTAFDMLSHGRSPDWDGQGNYQLQNVEAGLALLTQPVDLMGHSFGATVALRMAMARPALVRSLTLIEPVLFAAARADDPGVLSRMEAESQPVDAALAAGDIELAARLFNRMWGTGDPKWPDLPEQVRAAMVRAMPVIPASYQTLHLDENGTLAAGALDPVSMPVLLLSGGASLPVMQAVAAGLSRRLACARCITIPGAGHMLPVTHPETTATQLRGFWAEH